MIKEDCIKLYYFSYNSILEKNNIERIVTHIYCIRILYKIILYKIKFNLFLYNYHYIKKI